jgi:uncharacterized protein
VTAFVDTSALFALVDEDDQNHRAASAILPTLRGEQLLTHAYVVVETLALVGRRLPWAATEQVMDGLLPLIEIRPVDEVLHRAATVNYRDAGLARISFVDRTSFAFMRAESIDRAFAFDDDFAKHGFRLVLERA